MATETATNHGNGEPTQGPISSSLAFAIGLIAVLPYASLLLSNNLILKDCPYSDYSSFQLPVREFVSQEFSEGRFPHWIPWLGCGIPLHATQQVGLCYPLLTPLLLFFTANKAIKASLFLHAILCYWGQYRLGRQLSLSTAGSALGALIVTQSGFFCTHLAVGHIALVLAYSLIPWLLSSVVEICQSPSLSGACRFAAVVSGLLLVGHPQVPYYSLLFGGIWAVASLLTGMASSQRVAVISAFGAGLTLGIAIAAVQLLPAWELLRENAGRSTRGTFDYASTYALRGIDLYRFLVPSLFGNPMVGIPEFAAPDFYHEKVCYLGLTGWSLAFIALFSGFTSRWPWGVACLIVLGIVISLGNETIPFSWLCQIVPGLTLFRCPGRCLSVVGILMALLAGRGFDGLTQHAPGLTRRTEAWLAAILLLVAAAAACVIDRAMVRVEPAKWIEFSRMYLRFESQFSVCALVAALLVIRFALRVPQRVRPLLMAVVISIDLGYFNLRCIQYEQPLDDHWRNTTFQAIERFRFIDGDTGLTSSRVRYSRSVSAAVRNHARMLGTNEGGVLPVGCEEIFQALEKNPDVLLRIAACRFVAKRGNPLQPLPGEALPRVWFCPSSLQHHLEKPIVSLTNSDVDSLLNASRDTSVTHVVDEAQRIVVKVEPATNGILVIADTWYPEWSGSVDGKNRPVQQTFRCFRGIPIEPGIHNIELRFQPRSFSKGLCISLAGLGAWLVMFVLGRPRNDSLVIRE